MNISNLLQQLGAGDGQGNVSSYRILMYAVLGAILIPKIYFACAHGTEITFTNTDLEAFALVIGGKVISNAQENSTPQPPTTPKP